MGFKIAKCCNCFSRVIVDDLSEHTICENCNKEFDTKTGLNIFLNLGTSSSKDALDNNPQITPEQTRKHSSESTVCDTDTFTVSSNVPVKCDLGKEVIEIPDGTKCINDSAFSNCTSVISVIMPDTIEHIGNYAFYGCHNLKEIRFSESLKTIGESAFEGCESVEQVIIPDSTQEISEKAFRSCISLKKAVLGKSLNTIAKTAFTDSPITELHLNSDVNTYAFKGMSSLTNIVIGECVKNINKYMFSGAKQLKSVVISNSVELIDNFAFSRCHNLETVTFGTNIKAIASNAFSHCTNLTKVDLPLKLEHIGSAAFSYCESISELTLPGSLYECGDTAFAHCTKLNKLTVSHGVRKICNDAFHGCINLKTVSIFDPATVIDDTTFSTCKITCVPVCPANLRKLFNFAKFIDKSVSPQNVEKSYETVLDVYSFDLCREILEAHAFDSRIYLRFKNKYDAQRAAFELIECNKLFDIPFFAHLNNEVILQTDYPAIGYPDSDTLIVIYKF